MIRMRAESKGTKLAQVMKYAIAIALFFTIAVPGVHAELVVIIGNTPDIIIGNTPEDNPGWVEAGLEYGTGLHDNNGKAIGISIPEGRDYRLHSFKAYLNFREGNMVLEMLDDVDGYPGDTLVVFGDPEPESDEDGDQWYTFTPSEPVILFGGQTYWFMISNDYPATGTQNWPNISYWRGRSVDDPVTIDDGFVSWAGAYYEGADGTFYQRDFPNAFQVIGELIEDEIDPQELVDESCEPEEPWNNHGEYVRCVSHRVEELIEDGIITEEDGDAIVSTAAQSDVGKKNGSRKRK